MKILIYTILFVLFTSYSHAIKLKGSGSKTDPYQITTILELQEVDKLVKFEKYFILMNDIDATETRNWNILDHDQDSTTPDEPMGFVPIGDFGGHFDGQGYIIRNLYMNFPKAGLIGLFGNCATSKIRRVGLENCDITGLGNVGGFCGNSENDIIEECYTTGIITITGKSDEQRGAGFCGFVNNSNIRNCYSTCFIKNLFNKNDYLVASFCFSWEKYFTPAEFCYTTGKAISLGKVCAFGATEHGNYCYWDIETTGINDTIKNNIDDRAKGLSTEDMMKQSSYRGWDFKNVWYIDEGKDYPKLRAFRRDTKAEETGLAADKLTIDITPSPATVAAQIRYSASYTNIIKIAITNIFGEEVAVPVSSQSHAAGQFTSELDVSAFPSGVYFCVLQTPAGAVTKQFVVVH
ncbi:MAG: hypothetical protein HW421_1741 [Ignavibacteria bacterium]|nr:hypothetical protein [Ignavibacteria bacterium]